MNPLYPTALQLQEFCDQRGWKFCIIGGLAVARWGRPRVTQDIDLSLLTGFGDEAQFIDPLLSYFRGRRADAREFALLSRVLLLEAENGVFIDIALAGLPFEERMIERATPFDYAPNVRLITASAEDLVVTKSFAARHRDWNDVEGILVKQGDKLDWDYIERELSVLCELKETPEILEQLQQMRESADSE